MLCMDIAWTVGIYQAETSEFGERNSEEKSWRGLGKEYENEALWLFKDFLFESTTDVVFAVWVIFILVFHGIPSIAPENLPPSLTFPVWSTPLTLELQNVPGMLSGNHQRASAETRNTEIPSEDMLHLLFDRQLYTNRLMREVSFSHDGHGGNWTPNFESVSALTDWNQDMTNGPGYQTLKRNVTETCRWACLGF